MDPWLIFVLMMLMQSVFRAGIMVGGHLSERATRLQAGDQRYNHGYEQTAVDLVREVLQFARDTSGSPTQEIRVSDRRPQLEPDRNESVRANGER